MAFSYKEYTSITSGQREFAFAFDAVAKDTTNIKVTIGGKHLYDGVSKYNTSTRALDDSGTQPEAEYTVSSGSITIKTTANSAAVTFTLGNVTVTNGVPTLSTSVPLRIYRETNRDTAEVTFSSGSILADSDLNRANNQGRFLALEAVDRADESMAIDADDSTQYDIQISGADKRIFGVADPDNTNDAASKAYVDGVAMGSGANIVTTNGSQTLTAKTLTSPVLNTGVSGSAILDSDTMSGASATTLSTSESIKAYVDAQNTAQDLDATTDSGTIDIALGSETLTVAGGEGIDTSATGTTITIAGEDATASNKGVASFSSTDFSVSSGAVSLDSGIVYQQGKPHIIPGVLYPAVAGNDINGTDIDTSHGSTYTYGTTHTDGRKYYYTDIKGSKPIKDPRIGGHFGSQRHKFKSIQLLEQETATHGSNVYSVDGREYIRAYGTIIMSNDAHGSRPKADGGDTSDYGYFEIVGYFSSVNSLDRTFAGGNTNYVYKIDGGSFSAEQTTFTTSASSPLGNRYVDKGSLATIVTGQTLGIHTITIRSHATNDYLEQYGIELIAQDTTSTANRSKIQIPSQDVVSYGKKFNVSGTPHYDPFNGFTSGNLAAVQALGIDTDTSLGLSKWLPSDAGTTYYRPFNGGRIIKWVDSSGAIKTSVNMMPPNAKSIANSASPTNAFATRTTASHFGTNNAMNSFEAGTDLDVDQLSEVAKTFHFREFGNGSANGGTNSSSHADVSMLSTNDDVAYVMDDGTTSFYGKNADYSATHGLWVDNDNDSAYLTFIGTGISWDTGANGRNTFAQNLPFGTHIIQYYAGNHGDSAYYKIDGVTIKDNFTSGSNYIYNWAFGGASGDITFHQPKKPPIPEDACVLADYMLMADFVPQTSAGPTYISKGTRRQNVSRDVFVNHLDGATLDLAHTAGGNDTSFGYYLNQSGTASSETRFKVRIPSFGTNYVLRSYQSDSRSRLFIGDTSKDNGTNASSGAVYVQSDGSTRDNTATYDSYAHLTSSLDLGSYNFGANAESGTNLTMSGFDIATPIHTSFHYQPFETPFLNELVGGDRNMEQTNLICSPNGHTWDSLTKNTSYLGNQVVSTSRDGGDSGVDNDSYIYDVWRGTESTADNFFCKNSFSIAYDRVICLKDGQYNIDAVFECTVGNQGLQMTFFKNGTTVREESGYIGSTFEPILRFNHTLYLKRGDYIQFKNRNISDGNGDGAPEGDRIKSTKLNIFKV